MSRVGDEPALPLRRRFTAAVLWVTLILAAGAVPLFGWFVLGRASLVDGGFPHSSDSVSKPVQIDLALRAAAIRRFEAEAGRLPDSLSEVDLEGRDVHAWVEWIRDDPRGQAHADTNRDAERASWRMARDLDREYLLPWEKDRPRHHDCVGLPILFHRGSSSPEGPAWIRSDDPLPPSVIAFLEAHDGIPPPAGTPFALCSLVLRAAIETERTRARQYAIGAGIILLVIAALITVFVHLRRSRWGGALGLGGRFARVAAVAVALLGLLPWLTMFCATCYMRSFFRVHELRPEERLALLEDAVARGEVEPDVAAKARAYIEKVEKW